MQGKSQYNFLSQSSYINSSLAKLDDPLLSRNNFKNQLERIGKINHTQFKSQEPSVHNSSNNLLTEQQKQFTKSTFQSQLPFSKTNNQDLQLNSYLKNSFSGKHSLSNFNSSFTKQQQQQQTSQNSLFFSQFLSQKQMENQQKKNGSISKNNKLGLTKGFFEMEKFKNLQFSPGIKKVYQSQENQTVNFSKDNIIQQIKSFNQEPELFKNKKANSEDKNNEKKFLSSLGQIQQSIEQLKQKNKQNGFIQEKEAQLKEKKANQNLDDYKMTESQRNEYEKQIEQQKTTIADQNNTIENQKSQINNFNEKINSLQQQLNELIIKNGELEKEKAQW